MKEEELKSAKDKLLDKLFLRHLSKTIGRGLLSVGTSDIIFAEQLKIPAINSEAKISTMDETMPVEIKDEISKELLQWPQFHNGASAALQIGVSLKLQREKDKNFVRNWIMQHKP